VEGLGPNFTLDFDTITYKPYCLKLNKMFCHNSCAAIFNTLKKTDSGSVSVDTTSKNKKRLAE